MNKLAKDYRAGRMSRRAYDKQYADLRAKMLKAIYG